MSAAELTMSGFSEDVSNTLLREYVQAYQLPMPAYGGCYCKLGEFLPSADTPVTLLPRSSLALMLMSDVVISDVEIDWTVHIPLILHMALLGLDQSRMLVNDHCKRIMIHLLISQSEGRLNPAELAPALLALSLGVASAPKADPPPPESRFDSLNSRASTAILTADDAAEEEPEPGEFRSLREDRVGDAVLEMLAFLSRRTGSPVWAYEDVTAKVWRIPSGEALTAFVAQMSRLFSALLPAARIETRWAQTALHLALSCSNRHYAGRSFQAFRALRIAPTSAMISDILSRLVETVGEQGDDMQGYVTEIILTLDSSILHMEVAEHSLLGPFRGGANSPCEAAASELVVAASPSQPPPPTTGLYKRGSPTHARSTSYNAPGLGKRLSPSSEKRDSRLLGEDGAGLPRSKSAQALKSVPEGQEEHVASLAQLLWIAVSLVESEQEHEFSLGLQLLLKLMGLPELERADVVERLERMVKQLQWTSFPGLLPLVLRGCTLGACFEATAALLIALLPVLDWPVVDSSDSGFALIVAALAPYLISHYEEPNKLCVEAAESFAQYCAQRLETVQEHQAMLAQAQEASSSGQPMDARLGGQEHPLEHLGTVMRLYAKRSFSRDCFQWTKCVVKYLHDATTPQQGLLLVLLSEMLERWSGGGGSGGAGIGSSLVVPVLQVMFCVYQHVELTSSGFVAVNASFLRSVGRHVAGPNWREAGRILKLAVTRNSSFVVPGGAAAEAEGGGGRELPGRTLEFSMDVAALTSLSLGKELPAQAPSEEQGSPRKPQSSDVPSLRRTRDGGAQMRVREHLVNLLNASGLRVGLPKSPSSSHDIGAELPSSVYSASSGELTAGAGGERASTPSPSDPNADFTSDSFPRVFKEFDFLEAEHDSVSESADSCFNWLSTMRPRSISSAEVGSLSGAVPGAIVGDDDRSLVVMGESAMSEAGGPTYGSREEEEEEEKRRSESESSEDEESASSQTEEDVGGCGSSLGDSAAVDELPGPLESSNSPLSLDGSQRHFLGPPQLLLGDQPGVVSRASLSGSVGTPSLDWGRESMSVFGSVAGDRSSQPTLGLGFAAAIGAPAFPVFTLECSHHGTGQVDESWAAAVGEMASDPDGSATAHASLVFAQLYRESVSKVCGLLRDACHFLGMNVNFRGIAAQFLDALDVLMRIADCPFLFLTPQLLRVSAALARQRCDVFELREHYETFQERREHTIRTLNSVKSSLKLQLLGQRMEEQTSIEQEIELCRSLHKLFFQLLLMIEGFKKMTEQYTGRSDIAGNMSAEILVLQRELLCAINEIGSGGGGVGPKRSVGSEGGVQSLVQLLSGRDFKGAIRLLRSLRTAGPRSELVFGCCEEEDVEVLLLLYCKAAADNAGGGAFAVVGSEAALSESCSQLRETNLCLSAAVRTLSTSLRNPRLSLHSSSSHLSSTTMSINM